jgi:hypothetical protein
LPRQHLNFRSSSAESLCEHLNFRSSSAKLPCEDLNFRSSSVKLPCEHLNFRSSSAKLPYSDLKFRSLRAPIPDEDLIFRPYNRGPPDEDLNVGPSSDMREEMYGAKAISNLSRVEQRARIVKQALKAAADRVPGLKAPHAKTARQISGHRTVPRKFVQSLSAVVDRTEDLRDLSKFDTSEARAVLQFEEAFRSVIDQVAILLASLTYTVDLRYAPIAEKALRTYAIAKGLARDSRRGTLESDLRRLKADLGRKGPKKKKKTPAP